MTWAESGAAMPGVLVTLDGRDDVRAHTDSLGRFALPAEPGRHALETRGVGIMRRVDSLDLPLPPGRSLVLELFAQTIDGPCQSAPLVWVPTPWWQPW